MAIEIFDDYDFSVEKYNARHPIGLKEFLQIDISEEFTKL